MPVYASGLNPDAQALSQVEAARGDQHRSFKIKIGFGEARDLATLRPVFAGLKSGERIMVDINQGWELRNATRMVQVLSEFPLSWIEEPLAADRPSWEWSQVAGASRRRSPPARICAARWNFTRRCASIIWASCSRIAANGAGYPRRCRWRAPSWRRGELIVRTSSPAASANSPRCICWPRCAATDCWRSTPTPIRCAAVLIDPVLRIKDGTVTPPTAPGLGIEPDIEALSRFVVLKLEQDA